MASSFEPAIEQVLPQAADAAAQDHTADSVPLAERRDPLTMGLLWVTMTTGFPSVLIGFTWYGAGLSLSQVVGCALLSCAVVMLYCLPSCLLGTHSGLTYALLSRKVFGRWGSWVVSLNMMWICLAWYGLTAVFLADGLEGLYHFHWPPLLFSCVLAFAMAFNNFFGFDGVANFARYLAGPVLVAWVGMTFCKAVGSCPATVWSMPGHVADPLALTLVSAFVIGYSVWGNEADYWRYGKPKLLHIMLPLAAALLVGEVLFPVTGWMLARETGVTTYGGATALMNQYAFGGWSIVAALVLFVTYFAVNDSTLYGAINALQNVHPVPRRRMVAGLAVAGSIAAAMLTGVSKNFENVASLSCVFLPSATVIILAEQYLVSRFQKRGGELTYVPSFEELPAVSWAAVLSLLAGCGVGVLTAGIFPGSDHLRMGVPALQAWTVSFLSYLTARFWQFRVHRACDNSSSQKD